MEQLDLFPTKDSLNDVHIFAQSKLPVTDKNQLTNLFNLYHNTLLKVLEESK